HVGGERLLGIAGPLADTDDASGVVAFENGTVFSKGELAGCVFCRLPIGIVGAALNIVNHLTVELEWNAQLDNGFRFPLLCCYAVSGSGNRSKVASATRREREPRRTVKVHYAPTGQIALDGAGSLFFILSPRGIRNRSQLAMQVIHGSILLSGNRCPANHSW